MPVYNGQRFLEEAIESVLAQTYQHFELLIADDASTDDSVQIAQRYAQRDSRIMLWRNPTNKGLFANYNECFARASGPLIKPFAQDDVWHEEIVQRLAAVFTEHPSVSLAAVKRLWLTDSGEETPLDFEVSDTGVMNGSLCAKTCLLKRANLVGEPSAVMFPRQLAAGGFDTMYYHLGDLDLWLRLLQYGDYFYVHDPLCFFRRHEGGATTRNIKQLLFALDQLKLADQHATLIANDEAGIDELKINTTTDVARFVSQLFESGEITVDDVTANSPDSRQSKQFQKLAFYALLAVTQMERKWQPQVEAKDAHIRGLEQSLDAIHASKRWQLAGMFAPLAHERKVK